ncbi:hypothetical protein ABNN70_04755 [Sporolactobacillus sp. Y61]|uniref:Uncharacterized protein n=1 Tax=Sporolactobacillus sp. Y61 TaxID=3160863 RepID=A0AAU8IHS1_9BACL
MKKLREQAAGDARPFTFGARPVARMDATKRIRTPAASRWKQE